MQSLKANLLISQTYCDDCSRPSDLILSTDKKKVLTEREIKIKHNYNCLAESFFVWSSYILNIN